MIHESACRSQNLLVSVPPLWQLCAPHWSFHGIIFLVKINWKTSSVLLNVCLYVAHYPLPSLLLWSTSCSSFLSSSLLSLTDIFSSLFSALSSSSMEETRTDQVTKNDWGREKSSSPVHFILLPCLLLKFHISLHIVTASLFSSMLLVRFIMLFLLISGVFLKSTTYLTNLGNCLLFTLPYILNLNLIFWSFSPLPAVSPVFE